MPIAENLRSVLDTLPKNVTLVAVSKYKSAADIRDAYNAGQRVFGESKIQEMTEKQAVLPEDIQWHMIGHVQRNKVKYMASYVSLIHGVDSFRLLKEIDKQAQKNNRIIDCLLQVHIAEENTKFGFDKNEILELIKSDEFLNLGNIRIKGLMGMATFTDNQHQIRKEFSTLKQLFDELQSEHHPLLHIEILSMGMSNDYPSAIEQGSNMVRIGSKIFGQRY